ncbi:phage baseplate assembly protein V [Rhodobacter capsulatus]|uniref:phage baseplate assembly protein V n=1 Tax=Rhodobacter capsulatus TaxID=1061 RepID=UPI004026E41A
MADLPSIIADLRREVAELSRRQANVMRTGKVVEVDAARGLVRLDVGDDGAPLLTPMIPWPERAGARRSWNPPTVGEVMTVLSPSGDLSERSIAVHGGFTDATPAPSGDGDAAVFAVGGVTITIKGDSVVIEAPQVTVNSPSIDLGGTGGKPVARIGDQVDPGTHKIISGSGTVRATG